MDIDDLIDEINKSLNKSLDFYSTTDNINVIEVNLKNRLQKYVNSIQELQTKLFLISKIRKGKKLGINFEAFTMCAIGAKHSNVGAYGTSYGFVPNNGKFMLLLTQLKRLGRIGDRSHKHIIPGHRNIVGKCAEIKASFALHKKRPIHNLRDIEFTNAYRPRTMQIIKRCNNCVYIFGNV